DALARDGFEVRAANRLGEFDRLLEGWRPDVVLTDVNMPELSGAQLCRELKARFKSHSVPVVLLSSLSDAELERVARDCGADAYRIDLELRITDPDERARLDQLLALAASQPSGGHGDYRVLLVEDNELICDMFAYGVKKYFGKQAAVTVDVAGDGEKAWHRLG